MAATQKNMDAVSLLKADHRKVEELFEKFEKAKGSERKATLARQICTELVVHTVIEEEIFYPACAEAIDDEELLDEAYVEHDGAKVLVAELIEGDPAQEFFDAKVTVLSEMIKHHVEEEEKRSEGLFAKAKAADMDIEELGRRMAERKKELMAEIEKGGLPAPETRTFTGHRLEQGEPVEAGASH